MKTLMQRKIIAIAAAAMIGLATTSDVALARVGGGFGGGFGGGHVGGFSAAHIGGLAGQHIGGLGGHMGGLGVHPMGVPGIAMDHGFNGRGLDHTPVSHDLRDHHLRGLYVDPLYDTNDCGLPYDLQIESCPVGSTTE